LSVSDCFCTKSEEGIAIHDGSTSPCELVCKAASKYYRKEDYIPVNFIDDEIRAMILGWEMREMVSLDAKLEISTTISNDVSLEPARTALFPILPEPPKKFVRSLSRQKLASGK
jgi:uncharacterized protein YbaR (Trm112 family)